MRLMSTNQEPKRETLMKNLDHNHVVALTHYLTHHEFSLEVGSFQNHHLMVDESPFVLEVTKMMIDGDPVIAITRLSSYEDDGLIDLDNQIPPFLSDGVSQR